MELEGYSLVVLDRLGILVSIGYRWTIHMSKDGNHTVLHRLRRDSAPYSDGGSQ